MRRIALVNCDMRYLYSHQRESGYLDELEQLELSWSNVAYTGKITCEAGSAARAAGLRVPEDLARWSGLMAFHLPAA